MKRILLFAAALAAIDASYAQFDPAKIKSISISKVNSNGAVTATREIGRSSLECVYKAEYPVNGNGEVQSKEDRMILQIDGGRTKFYSHYDFALDSMRKANPDGFVTEMKNFKSGLKSCIYRNWPEDGRMTLTDAVSSMYYRVVEDMPVQEWTIGDETREVLGYECRCAECDFRGRHYVAWFAEDIPASVGPWKLGGLPGLIMAAADSEGQYTFEIIGLRSVERPIEYVDRNYIDTAREKYLRQRHAYVNDPLGYGVRQGEMHIELVDGSEYAPDESDLSIVMMETDYKH